MGLFAWLGLGAKTQQSSGDLLSVPVKGMKQAIKRALARHRASTEERGAVDAFGNRSQL
jgi:hypothetical protein